MFKYKFNFTNYMTSEENIKYLCKFNTDVKNILFRDKQIYNLIDSMFNMGAMLGLDWEVLINFLKDIKEIKWSDKLKTDITKYKKAIVVIRGGKELTMDYGFKILKKHFSELEHLEQFIFDETLDEIYVEYLLMR